MGIQPYSYLDITGNTLTIVIFDFSGAFNTVRLYWGRRSNPRFTVLYLADKLLLR